MEYIQHSSTLNNSVPYFVCLNYFLSLTFKLCLESQVLRMVLADGVESAFSEWLLSLQMPLEHWPIPRVIPIWAVVSWPHSQLASCRRLVNRDTTWPEWSWQVLLRLWIWWWLEYTSIRFCHITCRGIWFWIKTGHALQQKRKDEPKEWTVDCSSLQGVFLQFCVQSSDITCFASF